MPQWIYDVDCPTTNYDTLADCQRQWITDGKGDHKFDVVIKCSSKEYMPREKYLHLPLAR